MGHLVDVSEDHITIFDEQGNEIVHWIEDEWIEDPSVVLAIANAINLVHTKGPEFIKMLIGK